MLSNTLLSYCTTCKGRLWQLKQTLPLNILQTSDNINITLLDYHSDDGLEDYILEGYKEYLAEGRLRYFKLVTEIEGFDMAYAKHIVHLLAEGQKLFNLDADNFISEASTYSLISLKSDQILVPIRHGFHDVSKSGRIGITSEAYFELGGYNCRLLGMQEDDFEFIKRAEFKGLRISYYDDTTIPIPQTLEDKQKYTLSRLTSFKLPSTVVVEDHLGNQKKVSLKLRSTII